MCLFVIYIPFQQNTFDDNGFSSASSDDDVSGSCSSYDDTEEDTVNDIEEEDSSFAENILNKHANTSVRSSGSKYVILLLLFCLALWKNYCIVSNNGFNILLSLVYSFLDKLNLIDLFKGLAGISFPTSVYMLYKHLSINRNRFCKYVVCRNCYALYNENECTYVNRNGDTIGVNCSNELPYRRGMRPCGEKLMQKTKLQNGNIVYKPFKVYCYKSIINTFENFCKRKGFEKSCNKWKTREIPQNAFGDIYDGKVWKTFKNIDKKTFQETNHNYGFILNCDWFQPFKRRKDISVGVLYIVILNLPREERYKRENVLLVGVIPGLNKEPETLNTFLSPLVDELNALWKGVKMSTHEHREGVRVTGSLLCAAADIPAARKLCGFLSHSAKFGCSKCFKLFPGGFGEKRNYSGFDRLLWPKRSLEKHRRDVEKIINCKSKSERTKAESNHGCRYSKLLDLKYFDIIAYHVIDPMHNLFEGTEKSMFSIWIDREIITNKDLEQVDINIKSITMPYDYGWLPNKIMSNWGSFTADQWKNWTLCISLYALKGILPDDHYKCWHTFVLACRKLVKPYVTVDDVNIADMLFVKFCKDFEKIYGHAYVKPNMHLHCHLKECVENFGSVYGFWLFSFERYNGLLGSINTNNHDIECQLMNEFDSMDQLLDLYHKIDIDHDDVKVLRKCIPGKSENNLPSTDSVIKLSKCCDYDVEMCVAYWGDLSAITLPNKYRTNSICTDDRNLLMRTYQRMYRDSDIQLSDLALTCRTYKSIQIAGELFSSKTEKRSLRYGKVMADWLGSIRPGEIHHFVEHVVSVQGNNVKHVLAVIDWNKTSTNQNIYPNPLSVWSAKHFEARGPASFMPVQRIKCKYAFVSIYNESELVVLPMYRKLYA